MRTLGTAAAIGLATGIVGVVVGYFLAILILEHFGGPFSGVLIFLLPSSLSAGCAFVGFVVAFFWLWKAGERTSNSA